MTPEQLDEIEKLAKAATPGPWRAQLSDKGHALWGPLPNGECGSMRIALSSYAAFDRANMLFVEAIRDAALPLVKALREAWKDREDYRNDAIAAENECDRMLTSTALLTYLVEELVQVPRDGNRIEKLVEQSRAHLLRLREYEGSDE